MHPSPTAERPKQKSIAHGTTCHISCQIFIVNRFFLVPGTGLRPARYDSQ